MYKILEIISATTTTATAIDMTTSAAASTVSGNTRKIECKVGKIPSLAVASTEHPTSDLLSCIGNFL
jgi:Cu/Ag efflux protein CusF